MKIAALVITAIGLGSFLASMGCAVSAANAEPGLTTGKVGTNPGNIVKAGPYKLKPSAGNQLAEFSGGCFWGTEDIFRGVPGVVSTAVGYTGGHTAYPSYEEVCTHTTGHAETVLIEFDPAKVTYKQLLNVFWENHDPTTVDQQGPDFGNSYRSAIWTFSDEQARIAKASLAIAQSKLTHKIVTEIKPFQPFFLAEDYHQQYDEKHGTHFCPIGHGT